MLQNDCSYGIVLVQRVFRFDFAIYGVVLIVILRFSKSPFAFGKVSILKEIKKQHQIRIGEVS
jgi:hypothetical protein